jgi:transcriptional regulator with PAS, ATPase and Fis domain
VFEYESDDVTMPNIMMWASEFANDNQQPDYFPDAKGYNFSRTVLHGRGQFLLKKKTRRCAYWPDEKITREGTIKVELIKHGDIFSVICQGINLGSWRDKYPVSDGENNLAYLFLRPKSRVVLKSFAIYTADIVDRQRGGNLTGAYPVTMNFGSVRTHFYVNELAIASSETIMRLYLLTDVTAITSGLEKLKSQKKQMASLIRYKDGFVGRSDGIMEIRGTMTVVAKSNLSVLIEGETGTGKEVLARAIHSASPRKDMPFVKIDCTAFPEGLIESELFGHVKGAFTGAVYDRIGRMEQAQGGTVFLDEIGNLPLSVQAKLLGVLQDYSVQRVGATGSKTLDIRVIAATNAPLQRYITEGRFREDLFYRLNQYRYLLPPLRERREDIPVLAELFLEEANAFYNKSVAEISPEVVKVLYDAPWPGNVRQLRSVILRAALFCDTSVLDGTSILMDDLYPAQPLPHANEAGVMRKQEHTRKKRCRRLEVDKEHFMRMAEKCGGNYTKLAEVLKLSRPSVYKLLKKWNIQRLG